MQRRDFVRGMLAASVAAKTALAQKPVVRAPAATAPGPVPWMRGLMEVKPLSMTPLVPDAVAQTNATFFTVPQMATLRRLGEILQPAYKGYPNATEAGAPEFLDFLIGASPEDRKHMYQSGLDRLDSEARQHFQKSFAEIDAAQADQLIRPWLRAWMNEHPPTEPYELFINMAHNDIRAATVNSEPWSEAARKAGQPTPNVDLFWYPIDPDLHREAAAPIHRLI